MIVLAFESSCDETSVSLVKGREIIALNTYSQVELHAPYGGVFPEIAGKAHAEKMGVLLEKTLKDAALSLNEIDLIAATQGPGLLGCLFVGINAALGVATALSKPFIAIDHIEAHLFSSMLNQEKKTALFPALGVVLSGGHTHIFWMEDFAKIELLGATVDDAVGEALDKAAKILGWGYPGGAVIEKKAEGIDGSAFSFRAGKIKNRPYSFSFSGLKTALLYAYQKKSVWSEEDKRILAAAYQKAAFEDVIGKVSRGVKEFSPKAVFFGGGVLCNNTLKKALKSRLEGVELFFPDPLLAQDNAAMVAGLAGWRKDNGYPPSSFDIDPYARNLHWIKKDYHGG